jgi:hypothetical protein
MNKLGGKNPGARGRGRPKGSPNKVTAAVKDMILQALANKGGVKYLERQADENPTAFLTLVGKVLPLDVNANVNGQVSVTRIELVAPGEPA